MELKIEGTLWKVKRNLSSKTAEKYLYKIGIGNRKILRKVEVNLIRRKAETRLYEIENYKITKVNNLNEMISPLADQEESRSMIASQ